MDEIIETKKPRRAVKIFGKMIPVTVLALILGSGIGLATLGAYISNQMTAQVTVSNPIALSFVSSGTTEITPNIQMSGSFPGTSGTASVTGGETLEAYIQSVNSANVLINGHVDVVVTNSAGTSCADFTAIEYNGASVYGDCSNSGSGINEEAIISAPVSWTAGQSTTDTFDLTFATAATGTDNFAIAIAP